MYVQKMRLYVGCTQMIFCSFLGQAGGSLLDQMHGRIDRL